MAEEKRVTEREQYRVMLVMPWIVKGVEGAQDAINIVVSEVGKRVTAADSTHVSHCDISIQTLACADCETPMNAVLIVTETAFVGLTLTCSVRAASPDDVARTARRELGNEFADIPLVIFETPYLE